MMYVESHKENRKCVNEVRVIENEEENLANGVHDVKIMEEKEKEMDHKVGQQRLKEV